MSRLSLPILACAALMLLFSPREASANLFKFHETGCSLRNGQICSEVSVVASITINGDFDDLPAINECTPTEFTCTPIPRPIDFGNLLDFSFGGNATSPGLCAGGCAPNPITLAFFSMVPLDPSTFSLFQWSISPGGISLEWLEDQFSFTFNTDPTVTSPTMFVSSDNTDCFGHCVISGYWAVPEPAPVLMLLGPIFILLLIPRRRVPGAR